MAIANDPVNPRLMPQHGSLPDIIHHYNEANSQSFYAGELVYVSATDAVTVCASDATSIAGVAAKSATNVTSGNAEIPFYPITSETDVYFTVSGSTALTFTGAQYYALVVSSNQHKLDSTDSAAAGALSAKHCILPIEYVYDVNNAATSMVRCRIRATVLQFDPTEIAA